MKKAFTFFTVLLLATLTFGQIPQKMSYQAVIRNNSDQLVKNQVIGMKISILEGSSDGTEIYIETQTPATNSNGLVSIEIGKGSVVSGSFETIDWSSGIYFIKTETDIAGGTAYNITGISQILSVPYAFYARTAETANYNDLTNLPSLNINNWNTAYSWGNHSGLYKPVSYVPDWIEITNKPDFAAIATSGSFVDLLSKPSTLAGYGITDAMSTSHIANSITGELINNWNSAFSWGNHSGLYKPVSYVPDWIEITNKPDFAAIATSGSFVDLLSKPSTLAGYGITDAMSTSHIANSITGELINNWNSAFTWGNHAAAGYFKNGGENGGANRSLGNTDDYSLGLLTNNMNRLFITNTGKIGIGTMVPSQSLEVSDIAQINGQVYSPFFNALPGLTNGNSVTIQAGRANGGYGSDLQFNGGSQNGGNVKIEGGSANHFGQGGNVEIAAGDAFDTNSKGGSVLIKAKGYSQFIQGIIAFYTGGTYPNDLNNPIERMRLAGNGNLGLGTSAPVAKFDISGNIKITDGTQGIGKVLTSDASGLASWQTLSSGGFTGTGTTNSWTKWTSTTSIANAMASDDGTSISLQALTNRDNPGTISIRGGKGQSGTGHVYIYGGNYYYSGGDAQGGGNRTSGNVYIYAGVPEYGAAAGGSVILQASQGYDSRFANGTIQLLNGNVGIGTSSPNASAIVDMNSTTQGFLPPRMTKTQRDAIVPVVGLMIYNLSTNKPNFYDGTSWKTFDGSVID